MWGSHSIQIENLTNVIHQCVISLVVGVGHTISIFASVCHREDTRCGVLEFAGRNEVRHPRKANQYAILQVLVGKTVAVDRLSTSTITLGLNG